MAAYGSAKPIASGRGRACGLERQGRRLIAVDHHHDHEGPLVGAPMVPSVPECVRALSFPKRSSIPQLPDRSLIDRPKLSKLGGREMAILRLLQNSQLAAEDVAGLVAAYEKTLELYIWSTEATRLPNWWRGKLSRSARAVCEIRRRFQGSQSRRSARRRNRRAICCRCDQGRVEGGVRVGEATNFRAFKAAQPRPTHHHAGRSSGGPFALQAPVTGSRAWPS